MDTRIRQRVSRFVRGIIGTSETQELEPPFTAAKRTRAMADLGQVVTYEALSGAGCPMLLIHSVNAAACAKEMEPLFDGFRGERPLIAVDLPGFGASDRAVKVDRQAYQDAIAELIAELHERFGKPIDVVASSLSAEFAAAAITRDQTRVRSFWMLSPTGFSSKDRAASLDPQRVAKRGRLLNGSPLGRVLFAVLRTRPALNYFLKQAFNGESNQELARYMYESAHQRGASRAPLAFITGALFEPNVRELYYAHLKVPTWILYGDDAYTSFEELTAFSGSRAHVTPVRLAETRGLLQFDATDRCLELMRAGLAELDRYEERVEIASEVQSGWS